LVKVDFKFVELADPDFSRKGIVVRVDEIEIDSEDVDRCRTWATYPEGLKKHCKDKGTISGYDGLVCCDFIPIDIDDLDPSKVEEVVEILNDYDVSTECLSFYYSGSKGFHIEIPSAIVGIDPLPVKEFNLKIKKFIQLLGLNCDESMYKSHQLYRLSNTRNRKSNLFKIPIKYSEIYDDFKILAKSPRFETFANKVTELNDTLNTLWLETPLNEITKEPANDFSDKMVSSVVGLDNTQNSPIILNGGVKRGNRNTTGSMLTRKLMMEGYRKEDALKILIDLNSQNTQPLELSELLKLFESNWKYRNGFDLTGTKYFRANLRMDNVFQEYLIKPDKEYLSIYIYLLLNLNDEDKVMKMEWGEEIPIYRNQIMISNRKLAERLNLKTRNGEWNEQKVRIFINDLINKERFVKKIVGIKPKQKRTILTWIHFNFTQC
jgi:hypothetical protein